MSVKTELDKTIFNLRETRKAILARGGEIPTTAGLKDFPNAIFNIPADASLAFQEDNSLAYEKIVPSNAEEYAAVMEIGGLSIPNNNLCIADGVYDLNGLLYFTIDLGELEAGEYHLHFEGTITGAVLASIDGDCDVYPRELYMYNYEGNLANIDYTLNVWEKGMCGFKLFSAKADTDPSTPEYEEASTLNGNITGIMLCNDSDTDKSYKPFSKTSNLCRADGYYDLTSRPETLEDQHIPLDLGLLDVGTYQLQWYGDIRYLYYITIAGDVRKPDYHDTDLYNNYIIIEVLAESQVTVTLKSEWYEHGFEGGIAWDGAITGIMLVKIPDAESPVQGLEYEPYYGPFLNIKPTSLESRGANLFDESAITYASSYNADKANSSYGVVNKEGGYLEARRANISDTVYWYPFRKHLTADTYTISADVYIPAGKAPTLNVYIGLRSANDKSRIFALIATLNSYDVWERISVKLNVHTEDDYLCLFQPTAPSAAQGTNLDVRFKNITIVRGTETKYIPFSAEPIDTKALPEAVQSLDGWGLGIDAEHNNHIVWRNGRIFYVRMLDELDLGDFTWRLFTSKNYFVTYPTVDKWSSAWDGVNMKLQEFTTMPTLLCSKYNVDTYNNVAYVNLSKSEYVSYRTGDANYGTMIVVRDLNYANAKDFKAAMKGVKLIYPIAEPIETDITHLFTDTSPFLKVQGGGSIILHNKDKRAVPLTIKYVIKVGI